MISNLEFGDSDKIKKEKIHINKNNLTIEYPCYQPFDCSYVSFFLIEGVYSFSLYGGSGNLQKLFYKEGLMEQEDCAGAGGYVSGIIQIHKKSKFFVHVGGRGNTDDDNNRLKGGYNGGGWSENPNYITTGGGATDIRADKNDAYHRIIVAGGGGGSDDQNSHSSIEENDGRGGAGGGLISQSFSVLGVYQEGYEATQLTGYSFFQGESGLLNGTKHPNGYDSNSDSWECAGADGGWFGGFSSHNPAGGASGGSSFALTKDATIPSEKLDIFDSNYISQSKDFYAFNPLKSPYLFINVIHKRGVWYGSGLVEIIKLDICRNSCIDSLVYHIKVFIFFIYIFE